MDKDVGDQKSGKTKEDKQRRRCRRDVLGEIGLVNIDNFVSWVNFIVAYLYILLHDTITILQEKMGPRGYPK